MEKKTPLPEEETKSMNKETILKILAFMARSDLKWCEVKDYNECIDALNKEYIK